MDKDTKFSILVIGLPLLGLLYCGCIVLLLMNSSLARQNSLITGLGVMILPLGIAITTWIKASAKAYAKNNKQA